MWKHVGFGALCGSVRGAPRPRDDARHPASHRSSSGTRPDAQVRLLAPFVPPLLPFTITNSSFVSVAIAVGLSAATADALHDALACAALGRPPG